MPKRAFFLNSKMIEAYNELVAKAKEEIARIKTVDEIIKAFDSLLDQRGEESSSYRFNRPEASMTIYLGRAKQGPQIRRSITIDVTNIRHGQIGGFTLGLTGKKATQIEGKLLTCPQVKLEPTLKNLKLFEEALGALKQLPPDSQGP